jgi:hypothetical protein
MLYVFPAANGEGSIEEVRCCLNAPRSLLV